jgi:hypothetical protein
VRDKRKREEGGSGQSQSQSQIVETKRKRKRKDSLVLTGSATRDVDSIMAQPLTETARKLPGLFKTCIRFCIPISRRVVSLSSQRAKNTDLGCAGRGFRDFGHGNDCFFRQPRCCWVLDLKKKKKKRGQRSDGVSGGRDVYKK